MTLVKHGADVNAQGDRQRTPLHTAAASAEDESSTDCPLRCGKTILNHQGHFVADMVGDDFDEEAQLDEDVDQWLEDVERVRELLVNAPYKPAP